MPDSDSSGFSLPAWVTQPDHQPSLHKDQSSDSSREGEHATSPPTAGVQETLRSNAPEGPWEPSEPSPNTTVVLHSKVAEQPGQVPVFIPECVSTSRCIVEVGSDGSALDLAGDSGAVGRFSVKKDTSGISSMLLDLKGQIYSMKVVPSATTLCVVNIRQTEAKVETLLSDYVQLQPATWSGHVQDQDVHNFMADDDENYQQDTLSEPGVPTTGVGAKQKAGPKPKQRVNKKGAVAKASSKQQSKKGQKQPK